MGYENLNPHAASGSRCQLIIFRPSAPEWRESKGNAGAEGPGRRRAQKRRGGPKKLEYSLLQDF
jgi:hypothetical protein